MPTFLSGTNRGWVRSLTAPAGSPGAIVTGVDIAGCLITHIYVAEHVNAQFRHTLGRDIFVYVFGDRIGEMGVGGIAYWNCDTGTHGISNAIRLYRQNRLAVRGSLVNVTVGGFNFEGFMLGFRIERARVDEGMIEFMLSFALIPQELSS